MRRSTAAHAPLQPAMQHTAPSSVPWPRRFARLAVGIGILVAVMQLTPYLIRAIPALAEYRRVLDETGITPGVLFYNDVPQTRDGEVNNRDAIKYGARRHSG